MLKLLKNFRIPRIRLALFGVMFMLVLMIGSRMGEVAQQIAEGSTPSAFATATAETADAKKDAPAEEKKAEEKKAEAAPGKKEEAKKEETKPEEKKDAPAPGAAATPAAAPAEAPHIEDPTLEPENYTEAEVNILKKLSERRQELEKRDREVDQREALLRVTEQRVDKKIADLKAMQEKIRSVLGDADKAQAAQEASMVKIYETMKPKDAAKIFENLELPVLMSVVSRMKEARVAPILGEMDPVKAKELTTALMEKKPLPQAP